ncbi:uncharacterized protein LY89DRAFT_743424 [Mollisia scopiformis]|uniref:Glycoside hydrolase family 76 protein n=1 Tax=Mollisia scopiformis TaxID=149040 RepID=A0A132B311_MOLSC|nr:uncharacterized protein LY89DRAFT_743424 [Mollisia scopiformis]KUJ06785.1 hypothetical protein LY89DRAFT_743424 [Mollisia scopiformis]
MLNIVLILHLLTFASSLIWASTILNTTYVSPTFQQSRSNIDQDSLASIHALLASPSFPSGWLGQNALATVAQWDFDHKTRTFYDAFNSNETYYADHPGGCYEYWHSPLVDCFNDDAGWAALTSLEGYAAYGDEDYLQNAKSVHDFVSNHGFINETVIEEGYLKGTHFPNNTLVSTCDGKSMYGGVYWQNGFPSEHDQPGAFEAASQPNIDSGSTAVYALLSAKLCQITSNMWYCNRSYDALQFMDRFMIDLSSGFINGPINGKNCSREYHFVVLQTTGNYIAAYTLLSNLTSNATALTIARKTLTSSLTTNIWNTNQGVLLHTSNTSTKVVGIQSVLIRRLHFVYPFMDADVQDAIRQYVNIQYWSLVNYDSDNATKPLLYGSSWDGPKYTAATGRTQFEAIDVLNALALNPDSAFPNDNSMDVPVISL